MDNKQYELLLEKYVPQLRQARKNRDALFEQYKIAIDEVRCLQLLVDNIVIEDENKFIKYKNDLEMIKENKKKFN